MNNGLNANAAADASSASDSFQRELEQCHRRINELARAELFLAGENRLLEMVAKSQPLPSILDGICRLVEADSSGSLCSILFLDGDRLWHGAAPSLPATYISAFGGRPIGPNTGPCGRACFFKKPFIVSDIAADPLGDDYRDLALAHGLRACWSTPIFSSAGNVLGSFAVLAREPRSPTPQHQETIAQVTHLAAVAIERRRDEVKQRQNESDLTEAIDTIPGLVWSVRPDGEVDFLNQRWREYTGLTLEQARGWGWSKAIHPDDLARLETYWRSVLASGQPGEIEARLRRCDGTFRWFLFRAVPLYDAAGKLVKWYGQNTDIDERKRAEALLTGEKRMLERIAQGDALPTVLDELCRLVETIDDDSLAAILLLDAHDNRLWHAASPSLPASYTDGIGGVAIGPGVGSCGTAAHRREPVIVCDIAIDPLWGEYRDMALAHGLRASWSSPIFSSSGRLLGTFAILSREPRSPTPRHHHLIEQITHLASIAIDRKQSEEALRRSQAYLTEAQHLSRTGSFGWKPATGELIWSEETFCIMGYDPASRPTVEMVFDRVHPQDLSLLKETMAGAVRDLSDFELEHRLLFADGSIKHVQLMARVVKEGARDLEYVGALMDVTEHKRLESQLRSSERNLAEGQRLTKTGSWILDYRTGNTDWSVETCRIFGFPDPPPSPHYREFRARVRSEDREGVDRGLKESFETGEPRPLKYVFILPDGTQKNIETISEPVRDESGNVVKLMGTVMDVTERQKAEDTLRASERLARGQIETLTRTLDVTARESSPDKIVEEVLRNFTTQLEAHSSSVWLRDEASGLVIFEFALEEGCFRTKANAQLARISPALRIEDVWVWPAIFRTGKPCLVEDIREGPDFPWRANLLAQGVVSVLTVPMLVSGVVTGVIGIRFTKKRAIRAEELELAQALTNQVMLAAQLIRLSEQSREAAVIAERNRMARDIHDALAQGFTGVIVQLEAAEDAASKGLVAEAQTHLARAGQVARHGLSEARRSVLALRLKGHEDRDLCSALDSLLRRTTADTGLRAAFVLRGVPHSLPPECEDNLLRITQEAVTNALRHAQATHLKVRLHFEKQTLALSLCDDGRGFDATLRNDGFGLLGMRERVEQMRGQISIQSGPGAGTTIMITLPLQDISQSSEP